MSISKEYRAAIGKYNRARGLKSGDKGYITPKQALAFKRKFKDVATVEAKVAKVKEDKALKKTAKQYNHLMGYQKGDAGFITLSKARKIGLTDLQSYTATADAQYGDAVRRADLNRKEESQRKRVHNKRVKESLKDEETVKAKAQEVLNAVENYHKLSDKLRTAQTEAEYFATRDKVFAAGKDLDKIFAEFAQSRRDLQNKWRRITKLPEINSDLHLERYRNQDKINLANETINPHIGKDEYGNPTTIYTIYRDKVNAAVSNILDKTMSTMVGINGEIHTLYDIIQTTHIDNKKFWAAYHTWEGNGGDFMPANGRKRSDEVTASKFFDSTEGWDLLQTMLKGEYKGAMIVWDVDEGTYAHGKRNRK